MAAGGSNGDGVLFVGRSGVASSWRRQVLRRCLRLCLRLRWRGQVHQRLMWMGTPLQTQHTFMETVSGGSRGVHCRAHIRSEYAMGGLRTLGLCRFVVLAACNTFVFWQLAFDVLF